MHTLLNLPIKWKLANVIDYMKLEAGILVKPFTLDQVEGEVKRVMGEERE